ncbi:aminoacyl tRNA synthase complex-interacting multifunctional protein 1-like [Planococcus citri]|uniref:aminoacyl tRNA synthase complex-interacting multifunctional protein 1-like n=1 Tax=Planococcus citri TaxID=170843 RepID=UPI0031F83361
MIISETLSKVHLNSSRIAKLLKSINDEISEVSSAAFQLNKTNGENRISQLQAENRVLEQQVEECKQELIKLRIANNIPQIPISPQAATTTTTEVKCVVEEPEKVPQKSDVEEKKTDVSKSKKSTKGQTNVTKASETEPDFGLLDIKVGKIVQVERHPNADKLYVEKVDFGGPSCLTILSALVPVIPIEEMQNRVALFLTNLKPQKMRGITSEGMIMCASEGEKVEILIPPEGSVPGDIVRVEGYEYKPEPNITPKKNILEVISPHLKVNQDKIATYKGIPWNVGGKGPATTRFITNANIK